MGWVLLSVFLALLIAGAGVAIWAGTRRSSDGGGRALLLAIAGSVALAGLVGATVVAAWGPGSRHMGGMMSGDGMRGMEGMMGGSGGGSCPSQSQEASDATIEGFRYCPADPRVKVGSVVRWVNRDSAPHTVTSRGEGRFDSGTLGQGASWSHRYDQVGTFPY